uniref:Putative homing endonuclease n=1 Tax=viral metagenome TaxID=1070528 RepID=A0A6H1ZAV8_9ZZZZ
MNTITDQYLAGFFDGEGCIHFAKRDYRFTNRAINYAKFITVSVSQGQKNEANGHVLKRICEYLNSKDINVRFKNAGCRNQSTPYYRVEASSAVACKKWLSLMLPYLIVKRSKAEEALIFISTFKNPNIDPVIIKQILFLRQSNLSIYKIAKELKVSPPTVRGQLIKHNCYIPLHSWDRERYQDLVGA